MNDLVLILATFMVVLISVELAATGRTWRLTALGVTVLLIVAVLYVDHVNNTCYNFRRRQGLVFT